jgi:hypothetical protein
MSKAPASARTLACAGRPGCAGAPDLFTVPAGAASAPAGRIASSLGLVSASATLRLLSVWLSR